MAQPRRRSKRPRNSWDDLIRSLQSILSLDPTDVEARIKLVKLLALSGRVYQALELVNTDDEADSQNAKIIGLKAAILYKLNDKRGAVREAQKALAIDPGNADALVVLANERMASGDPRGALQILGNGHIDKHDRSWDSTVEIENI